MQNPSLLRVVGGYQVRVNEVRARWSEAERRRRTAKAQQRLRLLAAMLGFDDEEPTILAVGAPCMEDLVRIAK